MSPRTADDISASLIASLEENGLTYTTVPAHGKEAGRVIVELPGTKKLKTTTLISISDERVRFEAFICRKPDENFSGVYRYLLKRNRKLYIVAYTLDDVGDIYLVGSLSSQSYTATELDRILGQILETSDEDFNILLELGFATSIRKEWHWRVSRGESLKNLAAFEHLINTSNGPDWLPPLKDEELPPARNPEQGE